MFHVTAGFLSLCGNCAWISSEWLAPEYIVRLLVWYNFDMGRSLESLVQRNPPSISTSSLRLLTHYCWSNSGPLGCHPLIKNEFMVLVMLRVWTADWCVSWKICEFYCISYVMMVRRSLVVLLKDRVS